VKISQTVKKVMKPAALLPPPSTTGHSAAACARTPGCVCGRSHGVEVTGVRGRRDAQGRRGPVRVVPPPTSHPHPEGGGSSQRAWATPCPRGRFRGPQAAAQRQPQGAAPGRGPHPKGRFGSGSRGSVPPTDARRRQLAEGQGSKGHLLDGVSNPRPPLDLPPPARSLRRTKVAIHFAVRWNSHRVLRDSWGRLPSCVPFSGPESFAYDPMQQTRRAT